VNRETHLALFAGAFLLVLPGFAHAATVLPSAGRPPVSDTGRLPGGDDEDWRIRLTNWSAEPVAQPRTIETFSGKASAKSLFISSAYGWRSDPFGRGGRHHDGIDVPGRLGSRVYATGAGVVTIAGWVNGYGNLVQIRHPGGLITRYGHLSHLLVSPGMTVSQGEVVGLMGSTGRSTGSHLHYEVRVNGSPVNPLGFLGNATVPHYDVVWPAQKTAVARWSGWSGENETSLPSATIR
jgi:murein DD-endopeptidase MepM/ murein hydrolase activator NlpD